MALNFYSTLSRTEEIFDKRPGETVGLYSCGPTVYNFVHIGNIRSLVFSDLLARALRFAGLAVAHVMNITDVDDKTIKGSLREGASLAEFTRRYEAAFWEDMKKVNVERPGKTPRATEHVPDMIRMISALLEKGVAYQAEDGIYFNIEKAEGYGALAGLEKRTHTEARIRNDEYDKENPQDFALWKFRVDEDGETGWDAPFGRGRPGWHIECSAMSMEYLGEQFDIHTGGSDLIFPHHVNEIAQSESYTGKRPFVRVWMHGGLLNVRREKMAKSKGNFLTLRDLEEMGFSPLALRYLFLGTHYRKPLDWTEEAMAGAENSLENLRDRFLNLGDEIGSADEALQKKFAEALANDLNIPAALAVAWEAFTLPAPDAKATLLDFDRVLGLGLTELKPPSIPDKVRELAHEREEARKAGNYEKADTLRAAMEKEGYTVKDTSVGPKITPKR